MLTRTAPDRIRITSDGGSRPMRYLRSSSGAGHSPILMVLATLLAELSDNAPPNVSSGGVPSEHLLSRRCKRFRNAAAAFRCPTTGDQQDHEPTRACPRHLRFEATIKRIAFPPALERLSCPISHAELAGRICQPQ